MYKRFLSSELGRGTIILFITLNIFNVLNFLFHFSMGRLLGPADYGILATLMSIVYIYNIPTEAIQTIVSRYTSKFNIHNEKGKINYLISRSLKKGINITILSFVLATIFGFFLSKFLGINFFLIVLTNIFLFSAFLNPVFKGVLQGRKKFGQLGVGFIFEGILKVVLSIGLVVLGLKVFGAIVGVLMGVFFGLLVSVYFNKDIFQTKPQETRFEGIYLQSINYFLSMLLIYLVLSLDILLAKRFFSPDIAGQYSVLSMLGKIAFFGTSAIAKAMFPITSERNDKNEDCSRLFKKAILIMIVLCLCLIGVYAVFPKLIISLLYGNQYLVISSYLAYSAIAMSFIALTNLVLFYGLSTKGLRGSKYLFLFVILEIILLSVYHENLFQYVIALIVSNITMFIGSFLFLKK